MPSGLSIYHRTKRHILDPHRFLRYVVCPAIFVVLFATHQYIAIIPFYGDEPHYLMTVISIVEDLDLNGANQFRNNDERKFGFGHLGLKLAGWGYDLDVFYPHPAG